LGFSIDKEHLNEISNMGKTNFRDMQNNGFITLNKQGFEHYERDLIYLEQACLVYNIWQSTFSL
jgi:hypothetical protein